MYEYSPMNYPSKIPLLLLLGKVDRRVSVSLRLSLHSLVPKK